jgi:hypothetical protein
MPPVVFEPTIPVLKRETVLHVLDRAATVEFDNSKSGIKVKNTLPFDANKAVFCVVQRCVGRGKAMDLFLNKESYQISKDS